MTAASVIALAVAALISGAVAMLFRGVENWRKSLGERVGRVEKWQDFEDGRRAGYAEGYADGAEKRRSDVE
jgi:hypothetical protein